MNENRDSDPQDAFARRLQRLHPAAVNLDARTIFYDAGYAACRKHVQATRYRRLGPIMAAACLAAALTAPLSYRAGQSTALRATVATADLAAPQRATPDAAVPNEQPAASRGTEPHHQMDEPNRFAQWLGQIHVSGVASQRSTEVSSTLVAFHRSVVMDDAVTFRWPRTSSEAAREQPAHSGDLVDVDKLSIDSTPLAVSDLHQWAANWRTAQ